MDENKQETGDPRRYPDEARAEPASASPEARLRTRLEEQSVVARLAQQGFRATELSPLLDQVAGLVATTLGTEFCEVLELQPRDQSLLLRAGVGWNDGLVGRATVAAALDSQAGYTLSTLEPVIIEDLVSETRFNGTQLLMNHGVVSGISTIIGNPERPYGVLGAHSRTRRKFSGDDVSFLQSVANIVASVAERLASERALRQAQAYTRGLIESSVDGMVVVDKELVITDVNEKMSELTDLPKSMLIGSRFDACFTDSAQAAAGVLRTLSEGAVTDYDLTLRAASGKECLVSLNASIFYDEAGNALGVFASARDVTEQRRTQRELQQQQSYSRALHEASLDALFAVQPDLRITDVNHQAVSFTGYSREELVGVAFSSLFTEPERAMEAVRKTLADGFVKDYGLTVNSSQGNKLDVSVNASIYKDATGQVSGVFVAARDVSERHLIEQERSMLAAIVESSSDAIFSMTPETIVITWNRGAEKLYGYTAQEMVGRTMTILVPLEERAALHQSLTEMLAGEGTRQYETIRRRKDGSRIEVAVTMSPTPGKDGGLNGIAVITRDVTERKLLDRELTQARDKAIEAARTQSQFLANMSHEIRTPLNSIMGMTTILLDTQPGPRQKECALAVQQGSRLLLSIVEDILDFSRMSSGNLAFEQIDFDLEATVASALEVARPQAHPKGLEIVLSFDADVPRLLRGDRGRLRQVLVNLLSNAVKFTEHGEIVLRVNKVAESPTEATLRFEVRDTGIGIPKEMQGRLFRPFSQVDASDSRERGGTGLGLAIARGLVERMGGSIGVLSEPGAGSTFWFTAKFSKQSAVERAGQAKLAFPQPVRALVVDDNETNRVILEHQLRSWNFIVDTASGAEQALIGLRDHAKRKIPYRIALLDLQMPVMDGLELARRIRGEPEIAETVLVMLSSMDTPASYDAAVAGLDIAEWLLKPPQPSELHDALARALTQGCRPNPTIAESERDSLNAAIQALGASDRKLRALIVEDNATNKEVAQWHLERLGFATDAAASGGEALAALQRTRYDVVLMDCRMPKLDGYETTRRIRQREGAGQHTKIVAMTAYAMAGDREKCIAAGMDDYVSKPVEMENLIPALSRVLGPAWANPGAAAPNPEAGAAARDSSQTAPAAPSIPDGGSARDEPLDKATIESLRAKGDLLSKLIDTFLEETPQQILQLGEALQRRDTASAGITAHALTGAAAIFGAVRMRNLARKVEEAAALGAIDGAITELGGLRDEFERVTLALKAERGGPEA